MSLLKTEKGQFENVFASGLDLSEFDTRSDERKGHASESTKKTSASKALLMVKAKEKQQMQQQQDDDELLDDIVQRRVESLASSAVTNGVDKASDLVARVWCVKGFLFSIEYTGSGVAYFEEAAGMDPPPDFSIVCELKADLSVATAAPAV